MEYGSKTYLRKRIIAARSPIAYLQQYRASRNPIPTARGAKYQDIANYYYRESPWRMLRMRRDSNKESGSSDWRARNLRWNLVKHIGEIKVGLPALDCD